MHLWPQLTSTQTPHPIRITCIFGKFFFKCISVLYLVPNVSQKPKHGSTQTGIHHWPLGHNTKHTKHDSGDWISQLAVFDAVRCNSESGVVIFSGKRREKHVWFLICCLQTEPVEYKRRTYPSASAVELTEWVIFVFGGTAPCSGGGERKLWRDAG